MVLLSPHLDRGSPSVLCGDLNFAQKPEHRYHFKWPHIRPSAVSPEELHIWRTLEEQPGNFIEASGDQTHSCVYKCGIGTGENIRFCLNAGGEGGRSSERGEQIREGQRWELSILAPTKELNYT